MKIRRLNKKGDESTDVSLVDAQELVEAEQGLYYVVDSESKKIVKPLEVQEGQELMFLPKVAGG